MLPFHILTLVGFLSHPSERVGAASPACIRLRAWVCAVHKGSTRPFLLARRACVSVELKPNKIICFDLWQGAGAHKIRWRRDGPSRRAVVTGRCHSSLRPPPLAGKATRAELRQSKRDQGGRSESACDHHLPRYSSRCVFRRAAFPQTAAGAGWSHVEEQNHSRVRLFALL